MTTAPALLPDDRKRFDTAAAEVALWGGLLVLAEGDDGRPRFVLSRWALTREFADLVEVESFLHDAVGARIA